MPRSRWLVAAGAYAGFAIGDGLLGHWQTRAPVVLEPTAVDRWIGLHPATIWIYLSQYALLVLAIACCPDRRRLILAARAAAVATAIGFAAFLAWPTTVVRPPVIAMEPTRSAYA